MFSRRVISLVCRQPRFLPQSRFLSTTSLTYQKSPEDNVAIAAQKIREKATFDTFKIFDKDNSGFITHDEFEQVAIELDVEVTHEQITEIMSKIDHDKDGKVCYREFLEGKERGDLEDFKILEKLSKLTLGPGGWGGVEKFLIFCLSIFVCYNSKKYSQIVAKTITTKIAPYSQYPRQNLQTLL